MPCCPPQDQDGNLIDKVAFEVGNVIIKPYMFEGEMVADIIYTLDEKYKGYNIQFDLYVGSTRVPKYDLSKMLIIQDETHRLFQVRIDPGMTTHTFTKIPWLTDGSSTTYIATHSAIGDCPMPSLQEPY